MLAIAGELAPAIAAAAEPIPIGSRLELMVDDYLIERTDGLAALQLNMPTPREIVLVFDKPWEGDSCGVYSTVFVDGDCYRMYYVPTLKESRSKVLPSTIPTKCSAMIWNEWSPGNRAATCQASQACPFDYDSR